MTDMYSIAGKVAVVSGAGGVLGGSIARHFAAQGAKVVALVHREEQIAPVVDELNSLGTEEAVAYACNVLERESLETVAAEVLEKWGRVDCLINVAGGNVPGANVMPDQHFHDMKIEDWDKVLDLNLNGTVYPCHVFCKIFAEQGSGCILNISSMAAYDALTRVGGYTAAKTAVSGFTKWLASEMAIKYGEKIRVNALAPGFFIGKQNRAALLNEDGSLTERSLKVMNKTPMRRFGNYDELNGAAQFLCSDAASFVTGVILPVDGGFSAFSGV